KGPLKGRPDHQDEFAMTAGRVEGTARDTAFSAISQRPSAARPTEPHGHQSESPVQLTPSERANRPKQVTAADLGLPVNCVQLGIGTFILLFGVAFYLFQRPPNRTWL